MGLLITGASGLLGAYLVRAIDDRQRLVAWGGPSGGECFGLRLQRINLTDAKAVRDEFRLARPTVVIHTASGGDGG